MRKGTARRRRKIREMKEGVAYQPGPADSPCEECGRLEEHAEWCLAEDDVADG